MATVTYSAADFPDHYRAILDQARAGEARVCDADGTSLLLLPEARVEALRLINAAAANLATVEATLEAMAAREPPSMELREWGWLSALDADDLREFVRDIREAVLAGVRDSSTAVLEAQLRAWRITAEQGNDPLFRAVLAGGAVESDYVEVQRAVGSPRANAHPPGSPEGNAAE